LGQNADWNFLFAKDFDFFIGLAEIRPLLKNIDFFARNGL